MINNGWTLYQAFARVAVEGGDGNYEFGAYGVHFAHKKLSGTSISPGGSIDTSYIASCTPPNAIPDDGASVGADFHAMEDRNLYNSVSVWTVETTAYMGLALIADGEEWMVSAKDALTTTLKYNPAWKRPETWMRTIELRAEASENFSNRTSPAAVQIICAFTRSANEGF